MHEGLHEEIADLRPETVDEHRALVSLIEEFEAIDWYRQRADASHDPELKSVLLHNMNEEMEHACMLLEWLRRRIPHMDDQLKAYLLSSEPIVRRESETMKRD
jgi:Uncharacterized conserved protein, COG3461